MDYILFADEGNPEQTDPNKFFIYGGVFFPTTSIVNINAEIEALRNQFGLEVAEPLKFASKEKPKTLGIAEHTEMKGRVYEIATRNGVEFSGYAILHAIASTKDNQTLIEYGANILLAKFNQFLGERAAKGWANFDRLNTATPYRYLQTKFENRVARDGSPVTLENILGYSFTCDGASHLSSVADIIVGGFRYVINEPNRDIAGRSIMRSIAPLMWHRVDERGVRQVYTRGLVLRPREVKSSAYQADYEEIKTRLMQWANEIDTPT